MADDHYVVPVEQAHLWAAPRPGPSAPAKLRHIGLRAVFAGLMWTLWMFGMVAAITLGVEVVRLYDPWLALVAFAAVWAFTSVHAYAIARRLRDNPGERRG